MSHLLDPLIQMISKFPGLGPRSARRIVMHLIKHKDDVLNPMIGLCEDIIKQIKTCEICHSWDIKTPCAICSNTKRDPKILCIVSDIIDTWAIERTKTYNGLYHILGGILSAVDGIGPSQLNIYSLKKRFEEKQINEVIIALNSTIDGQTTAHYLFDLLKPFSVKITQLASGIPLGGELDYIDDGTIVTAFQHRIAV